MGRDRGELAEGLHAHGCQDWSKLMERFKEWWGFLFGAWSLPDATGQRLRIHQPPTGYNRGDAYALVAAWVGVIIFVGGILVTLALVL